MNRPEEWNWNGNPFQGLYATRINHRFGRRAPARIMMAPQHGPNPTKQVQPRVSAIMILLVSFNTPRKAPHLADQWGNISKLH